MTNTCINEVSIEYPGIVASAIYVFQLAQKCKSTVHKKLFFIFIFQCVKEKMLVVATSCFIY